MIDNDKLSFVSNLLEVISYFLEDLNLKETDKLQVDLLSDTFKGYICKLENLREVPGSDSGYNLNAGNAHLEQIEHEHETIVDLNTKRDDDTNEGKTLNICENIDDPVVNEGQFDGRDHLTSQQLEISDSTLEEEDEASKVYHHSMDRDIDSIDLIQEKLGNPPKYQGDLIIRCIFCDVDFYSEKDAQNHDQMNHTFSKEIKCSECDFTNTAKRLVVRHFLIGHKNMLCFDCHNCDDFFITFAELEQHITITHGIEVNKKKCFICDRNIPKHNLKRHFTYRHLNMNLPCNLCGKTFMSPKPLEIHQRNHEVERLSCKICGLKIREKNLPNHLAKHKMTERSVKCTECDNLFFTEHDMQKHFRARHRAKLIDHVCTICGYKTNFSINALRRHMKVHSNERPYKCDQCDWQFKTDAMLKGHNEMVHVGTRNHKCTYCQKEFKRAYALKRHLDIHVGNYCAFCKICDKGFVQLTNYQLHMKKHHPY